jgi:uncharacterized coiled-coil protein SlyX
MEARNNKKPVINKVIALSGPQSGKTLNKAEGGIVLLIKGANFGKNPVRTHVLFGKNRVPVARFLFSENTLALQAPILHAETEALRIQVGEKITSDPVDFYLTPGINPKVAGSTIVELYNMMDTYAWLLERIARIVPISPSRRSLMDVSADYINGSRKAARQSMNMLMQWQRYQPEIREDPIRTLEFTDSLIREGGMVESISSMIFLTIGPVGWLGPIAEKLGADNLIDGLIEGAENLFEDFVEGIKTIFKEASDFIEEHTKLLDGIENGLKVATPSLSAEVGVGVDVSFSSGEAFSAVVRGIDAIGQILGQETKESSDSLEEIKEAINKLEAKADTQGTTLTGIREDIVKQEEKSDRISGHLTEIKDNLYKLEEKIDKVESKLDRSEEKLDRIEEKTDKQEMKLDKLEGKADQQESKLDRLEEKTDKQEQKLDKLEGKADRQEGKLDRLEEKTDKQEQKLDKMESKADRQEKKLDRLEGKADKQEQKSDKLENKADRQERKLDKIEGKTDLQERKLDRQEIKLDNLEKKADMQEKKLDTLEAKADYHEIKLDKIEVKFDRLRTAPTSESSIANQRGGNDNISAAIAAIMEQDDKVYMKFAIDIHPNMLNQPGAYTGWINFERPANAARLAAVSIDLQYKDGSDNTINGILTVRDEDGVVYQRSLEEFKHQFLKNPNKWTTWNKFPVKP